MKDYIINAIAENGEIRAIAASSRETVETARKIHDLSPVVTAALGRFMTAASMMSTDLKGSDDIITLQIRSLGPIKGMVVTADSNARVKGYPFNGQVDIPAKAPGKLDVGKAVGEGYLSVIKDIGLREPYVGRVQLKSGEIAEDLTYYFAVSEQTPSSVGLGVLVDSEGVKEAGGFIIQIMPGASEETIDRLEKKLMSIPYVTQMQEKGMTPEEILEFILGDFNLKILDKKPMGFFCNCSKERVTKALVSIGAEDLDKIIEDGEGANLHCHFCNKEYAFSHEDVVELRKYATGK